MSVTDILSRLLSVEDDLIESLDSRDPSTLHAFEASWSALVNFFNIHTVDSHTSELANATARRVELVASSLLKVHSEADTIQKDLIGDLDGVLAQLSLHDIANNSVKATPEPSQHHSKHNSSTPVSLPSPYIAPAYKWLLKNIHNPYPSKETKELISRGTGTSLQNVDAWFLNARRRIGWTSISKKYFGGSKIDTIAAAVRALRDDPNPSVSDDDEPLPANTRMAFVEMENAAKELYSERYTKSELAGTLDRMVKDMTDADRERRRAERKKEKALQKRRVEHIRQVKQSQDAQRRWKEAEEGYPSSSPEPESLKRRFETPSSVDSQDEEDLRSPPPIAGRKRTSTEDSSDETQVAVERPVKRPRILSLSRSCSSVDGVSTVNRQNPFPLSPSSSVCSTPPPSTPSPESSLPPLPQHDASFKRKRRLSDTGAEPRPKRSSPLVRPRLQVVSDPLPKSASSSSPSSPSPSHVDGSAVLDWSQFFDQHFMAVTDELDTSGPIQMDMFDYSQFADYASSGETSDGTDWEAQCQPFKSKGLLDPISQSSSPTIHVSSLTFTDFDFPAPASVLPDFGLGLCATMGWPYVGGIPNKTTSTGSALEDTDLNRLDGLPSLALPPPYQSGISSTSEPRSDEAAFDPLGSIDWSSIIPSTIPPTRPVVSALPNPASVAPVTINPIAYVGSGAESRAEKLRKYQEHLAQARRLEEELAFV